VQSPPARLPAPTGVTLPLLQHAQQAGLQGQRHVADFIQEQRAAMGLAQAARAAFARRTGEGARRMAEQFRFDEVLGDGGAVDGHKRPLAAWAAGVQGARKHLLAHARFALDEHRNGLAHHAARLVGGGAPAGSPVSSRARASSCTAPTALTGAVPDTTSTTGSTCTCTYSSVPLCK
jgi:hypothetical protein